MKRNTFYILAGIIALIEVGILWYSILIDNALPIQLGVILGVLLIYVTRRSVTEVIEDERTTLISQKSALKTLEIFWVVFFVLSISSVVIGFNRPLGIRFEAPRPPPDIIPPTPGVEGFHFGFFGFLQLALLCLMIFLYVGFKIYYARKYGEFETDEE